MKSLIQFAVLANLVFGASVAQADLESQIVKTRSSDDCKTHESARMFGSGLAFSHAGQTYVVTSEHVVLHSRETGVCHEVFIGSSFKTAEWRKAELVRADWASGLALLRLSESPSVAVGPLPATNTTDRQVTVTGFVAADRQRIMDRSGKVVVRDSGRGLFARNLKILEVDSARGEFGMSGASVLSADESEWVGVLSHQVVMILPGRPSVIGVRTFGSNVNNTLLVIAAESVREWIAQTLRSDPVATWAQDAHREAAAQKGKQEVILYPGLRIRATRGVPAEDLQSSLRNGGGGNGVGTGGGGNGVGTGGDVEVQAWEDRIGVELSPVTEGKDLPLPAGLSRARARAMARSPLLIDRLECPVPDDAHILRLCTFDSIVLFLRMLETPGVIIPTPKIPTPATDTMQGARAALSTLEKLLQAEIQEPVASASRPAELAKAAKLIARLRIFVDNLEEGRRPNSAWINETVNGKAWETGWTVLYSLDELSYEPTLTLNTLLMKQSSRN